MSANNLSVTVTVGGQLCIEHLFWAGYKFRLTSS